VRDERVSCSCSPSPIRFGCLALLLVQCGRGISLRPRRLNVERSSPYFFFFFINLGSYDIFFCPRLPTIRPTRFFELLFFIRCPGFSPGTLSSAISSVHFSCFDSCRGETSSTDVPNQNGVPTLNTVRFPSLCLQMMIGHFFPSLPLFRIFASSHDIPLGKVETNSFSVRRFLPFQANNSTGERLCYFSFSALFFAAFFSARGGFSWPYFSYYFLSSLCAAQAPPRSVTAPHSHASP